MRLTISILALAAATGASAQTATEVWRTGGFATPESAYYDAQSDTIFVSVMGAMGPEAATDGRIATLSPEGDVREEEWATGLTDPKGMASMDGRLYVADVDGVHVFDISSGTEETTIPLPGAMFPNDVTIAEDGTIYVSDMMGNAIYRITDGTAEVWAQAGEVTLPNGLVADGDRLIVGSMGAGLAPDFSVETPGGLFAIDFATGEVTPLQNAQDIGSIDGVIQMDGAYVYDDNPTGTVYRWQDGSNEEILQVEGGAADLGAMGDTILIPNLNTGEVTAYRLQ